MPKQEIRHPDREKSTGAYSAAVEVDGWVFVSGQGPVDPKTAQPVRGTIEEEILYTLRQIEKILKAAGCTLNDVVKSTVHLADKEHSQPFLPMNLRRSDWNWDEDKALFFRKFS